MFAWEALKHRIKEPKSAKNFLYRFRSVDDRFLGAIENKKIYFSDLEKLNDPNEGIKNVFWEGGKEDWEELLKHFFCYFWKFLLKNLEHFDSDTSEKLDDFNVNFDVDEYINSDESLQEITNIFLRDEGVKGCIELISNKEIDKTKLQSFLFYFYEYIHFKKPEIINKYPKSKKYPNLIEDEKKYFKDNYNTPKSTEDEYMVIIRGLLEEKLIFNILTLSSFYEECSESIKKRYNKDFNLVRIN